MGKPDKNTRPQREKLTVTEIVEQLSSTAVDTQILFDRAHLEQTARFLTDLELTGLSPNDPVIQSVMPSPLRVESQTYEVNIQITRSKWRRFGLDLMYGGRIVTTFYEATYGTEQTRYDRLNVEVVAVPL